MYALEFHNLSYVFPNGDRGLSDISGAVPFNSKVVVLGSSRSGKTTLAHQLSGLSLSKSGSIRLFGEAIPSKSKKFLRERIGFVEQDLRSSLFVRTVWEYVTAGIINKSLPKAEKIKMAETALGMAGMLESKYQTLSYLNKSQKKRLGIARALVTQTEVLILDEPISGLDPDGYRSINALLEGLHIIGKTVIVLTHDVDFAANWADHLFLLSEGCLLAEGSPSLVLDEKLMEKARLRLPMLSLPFMNLPRHKFRTIPRTVDEATTILREFVQNEHFTGRF
ncbi:ATP-binding cassette domain-containing protein [Neobacillus bataviensis]|uniref:ATP-binding cassette domain-containing protein n=1 Tax=Neobacillus bataviensis TaxID=220685 RepID=UPI001CC1621B|nr:ATP-binding cassette domain-containing protein [Neobacillus bataviensis]